MTDKREMTVEDLQEHYLYDMTLQTSTGANNDLSKGTVKNHKKFDHIVERLIKDRDKAKESQRGAR